jgi:hypothetical protein
MRRGMLLLNGLVIAAAAWMVVHGTKTSASGLLPSRASASAQTASAQPQRGQPQAAPSPGVQRAPISTDSTLAALEERAALAPDATSVAKLAAAYLERDQPGLASAVIEKASPAIQAHPEIAHLHARALLHRGKVPEALAMARQVEAACEAAMDAPGEGQACPAWLMARSARQVAFLEEMNAAGIEDPAANPDGARAAYDKSSRHVRFVAMR